MARHGENIRKRKDGRWEGRYQVYREDQQKKVYHSVYGRTYQEVREKMARQRQRQLSGGLLRPIGQGRPEHGGQEPKADREVRERLCRESLCRDPLYRDSPPPEDLLFTQAAREWLNDIKITKKVSTYVKYSQIYRNYLKEAFLDIRLSMMTDSLI